MNLIVYFPLVALVAILVFSAIKILREYEREIGRAHV